MVEKDRERVRESEQRERKRGVLEAAREDGERER